jgi:hypothetical protein
VNNSVELQVRLARDEETGLWYVSDSELPGLRLEAATAADLIREIENVAPDLIELNQDEIAAAHPGDADWSGGAKVAFAIRPILDTALAIA